MRQADGDSDEEAFDRQTVAAAWRSFVTDGRLTGDAVRESIAASWRRSAASGIQPHGQCAPLVAAADLEARRERNRDLLDAAEHTWRLLSESLAASDNVFVVTDTAGVILDVRGNDEFVAAAARQYCGVGRDWNETVSGTNAIGTALVRNAPTLVRSTEHYVESPKVWDCAASPVRDLTDGSLLGILDITSVGDLSDHHSLALAVTAAHQIEHALHSQTLAKSVQLLNWYRGAIVPWQHETAVLLDTKARIIRATPAARDYAATTPEHFELENTQPTASAGAPLQIVEILPYRPPAETRTSVQTNAWHGGIVRIKLDDSRPPSAHDSRAVADVAPAFHRIITLDAAVIDLMRRAERMARAHSPILLLGETGTGKELFAGAIHASSPVSNGPFVAVNCGTLTHELAGSELLGYEPGAFTGAQTSGRQGKFEQANGGTLFLDEIGELPLDVQVHLLRVLQDNVVVRMGGNRSRTVSVRIIAATNRDLELEAEAGRFRSDLLFRLRVLTLTLPPLRERPDDIRPLITHHLQQLQGRYGLGAKTISDELMAMLCRFPWPGNVRQLNGLLESLYILSDRQVITPAELPEEFNAVPVTREVQPEQAGTNRLESLERDAILTEIEKQRHNMSAVARSLGISRSTLYRKLKQFGIGL